MYAWKEYLLNKEFSIVGKVNINPELFYGGILKKVGLPMKAMELRWKTSVWVFLTSYPFQQVQQPLHPKGTVLSRGSVHCGEGAPQSPGGAEVQLGIWPSDAPGWVFHWLVLLSGALERPRRSEQAQDCCPSSLLALRFQGRKLLLEGAPRQQIKALHKEEKKKKAIRESRRKSQPASKSLFILSINASITLCQVNTEAPK